MSNPSALTKKWVPGTWAKYGEPYDNYAFYSLYGWRVNPPNKYPQSTFNTPYDIKMRDCNIGCGNFQQDKEKCLEDCHLQSVKYAVKKDHERKKQDTLQHGCLENLNNSHGMVENYSNVSRSLPSHTSPRFRSYDSDHWLSRFCFYR